MSDFPAMKRQTRLIFSIFCDCQFWDTFQTLLPDSVWHFCNSFSVSRSKKRICCLGLSLHIPGQWRAERNMNAHCPRISVYSRISPTLTRFFRYFRGCSRCFLEFLALFSPLNRVVSPWKRFFKISKKRSSIVISDDFWVTKMIKKCQKFPHYLEDFWQMEKFPE